MTTTFTKRAAEVLDFQIDWSDFLGADTISTSTWAVDAGLTKNSDTHGTTTTTIWLSGGTANTNYKCTNTIVTASARTAVRDIFLFIEPSTTATPRTFYSLYRELQNRLKGSALAIWSVDDLKRYVNGAIQFWDANGGYVVTIDTTLATVLNQKTYNLPATITSIRQVLRVLKRTTNTADLTTADLSTSYTGTPVVQEPWQEVTDFTLTQTGSTVKMLLRNPFATTELVAVVYKNVHTYLVNDTDTTDVDPEYIYTYGRFLAHNEAAQNVSNEDRKFHVEEREAALRDSLKLLDVALRVKTLNPYMQQSPALPADW